MEVAARRARGTRLCRAVEVAAGAETDVFGHPEGAFSRRVSGTGVFETSIYPPLKGEGGADHLQKRVKVIVDDMLNDSFSLINASQSQ